MNIFLDSARVDFKDVPEDVTVGNVFNVLFNFLHSEERAIFKTIIDGKEIPFDELKDVFSKDINEFERLDFFTVNKEELYAKFKDLGDPFIEIASSLSSLSTLLNEGKGKQMLDTLQELPKMMHRLLTLYMLLPLFDVSPDSKFGEKSIKEYRREINPLITTVIEAFVREDTVEATDVAEYELSPLVETLGKALKEGIKEDKKIIL